MANFSEAVSIFMSRPVFSIPTDATLIQAQERLATHRCSSLAVTNGTELVGVISRTDLLRVGRREAGHRRDADSLTLPDRAVSEVMTKDVVTVEESDSIASAAKTMVSRRIHRVFVLSDNVLTGVLSPRDIMGVVRDVRLNKPITEFMSSPVFSVRALEPLSLGTERLEKARVSGLVVVDDSGWPVGIFTQSESLDSASKPRDTPIEEVMNHAVMTVPSNLPIFRAAAQAEVMRVRRVVAIDGLKIVGILTGIDFARAIS